MELGFDKLIDLCAPEEPQKGLKDHRQGYNPCFVCEGEPKPGKGGRDDSVVPSALCRRRGT